MSDFALDNLDRARLDWPEPILIDLISEYYSDAPSGRDGITAARLHVRFLHELIEGEARRAAFLRLELIACCAARGFGMPALELADDAAFRELTRIVDARFRNSARMRQHFRRRLEDAVERLPTRSRPTQPPAAVRLLSAVRANWQRPPQIRHKLAANG